MKSLGLKAVLNELHLAASDKFVIPEILYSVGDVKYVVLGYTLWHKNGCYEPGSVMKFWVRGFQKSRAISFLSSLGNSPPT